MLLNSILNFAMEKGLKRFYSSTADWTIRHIPFSRHIQRDLFDRIMIGPSMSTSKRAAADPGGSSMWRQTARERLFLKENRADIGTKNDLFVP